MWTTRSSSCCKSNLSALVDVFFMNNFGRQAASQFHDFAFRKENATALQIRPRLNKILTKKCFTELLLSNNF